MSKGSAQRPSDPKKFGENYDRIFGKKKPKKEKRDDTSDRRRCPPV